jgi:membrane protein DedA with SNARE-associated domain
MQPDVELGLLDANEITSTTANAATTPSTPPIIHFSRVDMRQRGRIASACPGGRISIAPSLGAWPCATIEALLVFALHLFHHSVASRAQIDYFALAVGAFASWVGIPGPGEPLLIAAAIVAAKHKLDIKPVLLWAFVGAVAGGLAGWLAGWYAGRTVMTARGPLRGLRLKAVERGEEVFKRLTVIAILLTPSWVAGIHRVGPVLYNVTNVVSAGVWAVGIGLAAYYVGPPVLDIIADVGWVTGIGLLLLVLFGVGLEVARRRRHRVR